VVAALALIRPGPASGHAKAMFVRRARGEKAEELVDPAMQDRLAETHGLLLYEEDVMLLLSRVGGIGLDVADELRAAIIATGGDEQILAALESEFVAKAPDADRARRAWAAAARFAAYSFSKAHAASYGEVAYLCAYAKAHYLTGFTCAVLNHHQGMYPLRTVVADFIRNGVRVLAPHVNLSAYASQMEQGAVRVGLDKIKGLSRRLADDVLTSRAAYGPFTSLVDLIERAKPSNRWPMVQTGSYSSSWGALPAR
jgi:DNA polymerase III alpha subunit